MVGVRFNDKHSFYDYGLILSSKTIEAPSVKVKNVDVTGADGVIDYTDFFGEPKFSNRKLTFVFSKCQTNSQFVDEFSTIQNELNGQKMNIRIDTDPDFYYTGRISLKASRSNNITKLTVTCDCQPYKLKNKKTVVEAKRSTTVSLFNLRKRTVPTITTTAETTIIFGTRKTVLSAGQWVIPEFELMPGNNIFIIISKGTTTFEYQEGGL